MKPFFKWSGGKRRELFLIKPHIPAKYKTFYEPFVGAGALWLDLEPKSAVVNDNYSDVINFYNVLKSDTKKLATKINSLKDAYVEETSKLKENKKLEQCIEKSKLKIEEHVEALEECSSVLQKECIKITYKKSQSEAFSLASLKRQILRYEKCQEKIKLQKKTLSTEKEELKKDFQDIAERYYYYYRDSVFNSDFDNAVRFYMLRQLSFSGMLRFGSEGNYNIPFAWYKSFKGIEQDVAMISSVFKNTKFLCMDWKDAVAQATPEDFVFLDPPYTTRVFSKYHPAGNFGRTEQMKLADWFKTKQTRALIIINKDEFTEGLYKDYIVDVHDYRYSVQYRDRMTEEDSNVKHLIAKNY